MVGYTSAYRRPKSTQQPAEPIQGGTSMIKPKSLSRRRLLKGAGAAGAMTITGFPAISYAQADVIKIGHLTPRTGFLGTLGEYAVQAVDLSVEEINAAGGVMGRKIDLIKEDSVNPQTASTKAERMVERDKVACIVGEISSASGLTISQVADRTKTLFVNTGCNSDELRGKGCKKFMRTWSPPTRCTSKRSAARFSLKTSSRARSGSRSLPTMPSATI